MALSLRSGPVITLLLATFWHAHPSLAQAGPCAGGLRNGRDILVLAGRNISTNRRCIVQPTPVPRGPGIANGDFDGGLAGWSASESGGGGAPGSVQPLSARAQFLEGDSFVVTLSQTFTVPPNASQLRFEVYFEPGFDQSDSFIPDAFEATLLDANGNSVVTPWHPLATSFFNVQEDLAVNSSPAVQFDGRTALLDLSGVAAGTQVTLFFDFIGADFDFTGGVAIDNVSIRTRDELCCWNNGTPDPAVGGQASHLGGSFPAGTKAADDFTLDAGSVHDLISISGTMVTNSHPDITKAQAELYEDCDGRPGRLLYTFTDFVQSNVQILADGYRRIDYTFAAAGQLDQDDRHIVLKGGTYWVALVGLTDQQGSDESFFLATDPAEFGVKGRPAHKVDGLDTGVPNRYDFSQGTWIPLDECCIGCRDLVFTVCATPCKILIDNGAADSADDAGARRVGERSERSASATRNSRAADDFVVPPCDDFTVCYIEGCIYTNCLPTPDGEPGFTGWFEILPNACREPIGPLPQSPLFSGTATRVIDLDYTVTIDGRELHAYRLEFHDLSLTLPGGRQYWISLGAQDTFSFNERAYFCRAADCRRVCDWRFNSGHHVAGVDAEWELSNYDFSFLIVGEPGRGAPDVQAGPTCRADTNSDGTVTVQDLFDYLAAFFAGCP